MIGRRTECSRNRGFTLAELAIVLVIISLLAGGMMVSLSAQQEIQRVGEARRQLADIREALLGYVSANGRFPPAADPTIATGSVGAGIIVEGNENGVLPWITLGLPETDPWGQRFTYSARKEFSDPIAAGTINPCPVTTPAPVQSSFALCSEGNINVTDGTTPIAAKLPAIVVSHGRNGLGGYRPDGSQVDGAAGDELENANGDSTFVSRTQSTDFDDEVIWVPLYIVMSRMIAAGRLP